MRILANAYVDRKFATGICLAETGAETGASNHNKNEHERKKWVLPDPKLTVW